MYQERIQEREFMSPSDAVNLFGGNEGKQLISLLVKQGYGKREYLVDGEWVQGVNGKRPEDLRFDMGQNTEAVKDIASAWKYVNEKSISDRLCMA